MGTLYRTFSGSCTSAEGYWTRNSSKKFSVSSDTGAISGATISSATLTISNFKSYSGGNTNWVVYDQNGTMIASTVQTLSANSSMHSETYDLEDLTNALINGSVTSVSLYASSSVNGNKAYAYSSTTFSITATCVYSDPSAPSSITLNGTSGNIHIPAGNSLTLAWSGASAGTLNPISGYQVYKNGSAYGNVTTSTSMTVDSPSAGSEVTYSVVTVGSRSNSSASTARKAYGYASPSAPTTVTLNGTSGDIRVVAGTTITLSWSGASDGAGNPGTGYQVYQNGSAYGSVTGNTSMTVACPGGGGAYTYTVVRCGTYSWSGASVGRTVYAYANPSAPTAVTLNGTSGDIHIPAGSSVTFAWSGGSDGGGNPFTGYQVYRSGAAYGDKTSSNSMGVTCPSAGNSYYYTVVRCGTYSSSGHSTARTVYAYSAPSAPTSVLVNGSGSITVDAGSSVTLSWSGASNGAGNAITGYTVYRATSASGTYSALGTTSNTSYTVTAHATMGSTYYYKVLSNGTYSNSGQSSATASITSRVYSTVGAPTSVTVSPTAASGGSTAILSWSAGASGTNVSVASYQVYRSSSPNSGYTALASGITATSYSVTASTTGGASYYYKVKSIANRSGYDSGLSSAYATLSTYRVPDAPIVQGVTGGKTYNPRPRVLATVPTLPVEGATQTVGISGFTSSRTQCASGAKVLLRKTSAYPGTSSNTVAVVNTASYGESASTNITINYEVPAWTDDPIIAGTTVLKAAHINEIRAALDDICTYYGIAQTDWEETIIAGVTADINWADHVEEIQETITRIANYVNSWDANSAINQIVLPTMKTAYRPSADVMNQLREIIQLL